MLEWNGKAVEEPMLFEYAPDPYDDLRLLMFGAGVVPIEHSALDEDDPIFWMTERELEEFIAAATIPRYRQLELFGLPPKRVRRP